MNLYDVLLAQKVSDGSGGGAELRTIPVINQTGDRVTIGFVCCVVHDGEILINYPASDGSKVDVLVTKVQEGRYGGMFGVVSGVGLRVSGNQAGVFYQGDLTIDGATVKCYLYVIGGDEPSIVLSNREEEEAM